MFLFLVFIAMCRVMGFQFQTVLQCMLNEFANDSTFDDDVILCLYYYLCIFNAEVLLE
jgi:hypothetical protein